MPKLPVISGKKLLKILQKHGYNVLRKKGSHVFVQSSNEKLGTVIPVHANEDLGKGITKAILDDLEISLEEFLRMI